MKLLTGLNQPTHPTPCLIDFLKATLPVPPAPGMLARSFLVIEMFLAPL